MIIDRPQHEHELPFDPDVNCITSSTIYCTYIMRREMITSQTKGADPKLGAKIHLAVWVEHGMAGSSRATDRIIWKCCRGCTIWWKLFQRRVQSPKRSDTSGCLQSRRRPAVKAQAGARHLFGGCNIPTCSLHSFRFTSAKDRFERFVEITDSGRFTNIEDKS